MTWVEKRQRASREEERVYAIESKQEEVKHSSRGKETLRAFEIEIETVAGANRLVARRSGAAERKRGVGGRRKETSWRAHVGFGVLGVDSANFSPPAARVCQKSNQSFLTVWRQKLSFHSKACGHWSATLHTTRSCSLSLSPHSTSQWP